MELTSKLLTEAVQQFSGLPGIGKKTALRLVLHLLKQDETKVNAFANALTTLKNEVVYCKQCYNISDTEICEICSSASRSRNLVCVVADIRDIIAIENTGQYNGLYHVLGGIISPIDGIGPADLTIDNLERRVMNDNIKEVILALKGSIEGDTTAFYIYKKLKDYSCSISIIARGISIGDEIEYADEISLGRSILQRTPFENSLK
ncbi:MAG: recombination protein RecR [Bacteroidia bacterium]|nr:recombination protein RecR [Bacteroidia bacterium]MCZ2248129.1 recombination mediator RecR [Bacteroidia bacterium]